MQPAGIASTRPEGFGPPAWGALVAALVNGLLLAIGIDHLPGPGYVTAALCGNAILAGCCTPGRPTFAASVLTLTGPFLGLHSSTPLPGFLLYGLVRSLGKMPIHFDPSALTCLIAGAIFMFAIGFAYSFPVYWLLVQFGRHLNLLLRKLFPVRAVLKPSFTDTRNIFPQ